MRFQAWRRVFACSLVLACLSGLLGPSGRAFAEAPVSISLSVQTPAFELDGQGVRVPGYAWNDAPGAPRLPVYGAIVELPPEGEWRLTYESIGSRILADRIEAPAVPVPLIPEPVPQSQLANGGEFDPIVEVDRPDPAIYGADAFYPAAPVVAGDVQWQRGRRLLAVRVYPFQYNPVTRELRYHPDLAISVLIDTVKSSAATTGAQGAVSPAVGLSAAAPDGDPALQGVLKIRTDGRGMVRLTHNDLATAGVAVGAGGVDPATFQMTNRGSVAPIQVLNGVDSTFDPGDLVIFYAEPFESRYTAQNVYWLSFGASSGLAAARISSGAALTAAGSPASAITTITQTVRAEVNASYYNQYPLPADVDHWFDKDLQGAEAAATSYALTLDDPLTTGSVSFTGLFYGGKAQAANPDQSVALRLNGLPVATFQWDGRTGYTATATAPASYLTGVSNQIGLETALAQLPGSGISDYWVYPDWIEMRYPAFAEAEGDRIFIEAVDVAETSAFEIAVSGFTTSTVSVYDVRNPRQPVLLASAWAEDASAPYTIHFTDNWAAGALPPSYYLTTQAALLTPTSVKLDNNSNWRQARGYDYIAIVHSSLWSAIDPLLAWRTSQGLRVAKVDVEDIYDEFSAGLVYPPAIRDFLANAYATWNVGDAPPEPPQYVLLVGDGHYDFKGYSVAGRTVPNLIPPYLIDVDPWIGETAADNRFVTVDGSGDILPDMAIGRIPARNAADVTAVVNKTLANEDPSNLAYVSDDALQTRISYAAGSNTDPAGAFHTLSDEARLNWLPDQYVDKTTTLYWMADYTNITDLNLATKAATGNSLMLQWFGHAGLWGWSADGANTYFGTGSLPNMPDSTQWAFSVDYSCWTGYFINLLNTWQVFDEQMLLYPKRGSIAVLGPSGKHLGSALRTLEQAIHAAIFRDRIREVGKAVDAAKRYYFAPGGGSQDVIDTEILFGDPALKLRLPVLLPTPPAVTIKAAGANAALSWLHQLDSAQYEVWRDTTPYFDPAAGQGVQVTTRDAGFVGRGASFTFGDDGTTPPPAVKIIGDTAVNYFWVLRSRNGDGVSALSNRVGEFDFALVPGG